MGLKWLGQAFIIGVPARDLTDAEVEEYGGAEYLTGTGLYEPSFEAKASRGGRENKALIPDAEIKEEGE